jgi:hypothetical protein
MGGRMPTVGCASHPGNLGWDVRGKSRRARLIAPHRRARSTQRAGDRKGIFTYYTVFFRRLGSACSLLCTDAQRKLGSRISHMRALSVTMTFARRHLSLANVRASRRSPLCIRPRLLRCPS